RRYLFPFDIFPDVELGPVEQGVDSEMSTGREIGLVLVPKLGRLVADIPLTLVVARGKITLLGPRSLLIGAGADDHAGVRLRVLVYLVLVCMVVIPEALPLPV